MDEENVNSILNDDTEEDDEDDIHICGSCKAQFRDVMAFVAHKKSKVCKSKATKAKKVAKELKSHSSALDISTDWRLVEDLNENSTNTNEEAAVISLLATLSSQKPGTSAALPDVSTKSGPVDINDDPSELLGDFATDYFDNIDDPAPLPETSKEIKSVSVPKKAKAAPRKVKQTPKHRHPCPHAHCSFTAKYSKDLTRHLRSHSGEKPFQCEVCDRTFARQDKLKLHQRIHSGVKPFQCKQCSYSCSDSWSLRKHERVHTNERPYQCQICSYRSKDASQLTVHLRTHTGDCPFICTFDSCSSSFKTKSDLTRHLRIHTGEKPYECSLCSYKSTIKSNVKAHMKANHGQMSTSGSEVANETATFSCQVCDFQTSSILKLNSHTRRTHATRNIFRCSYCKFSCNWEGKLSAHVNKKHGKGVTKVGSKKTWLRKTSSASKYQPCLQCPFCDAAFVRQDSYNSHVRQHGNEQPIITTDPPLQSVIAKAPAAEATTTTLQLTPIQPQPQTLVSTGSMALPPTSLVSFKLDNSVVTTAHSQPTIQVMLAPNQPTLAISSPVKSQPQTTVLLNGQFVRLTPLQ